MDISGSIQDMLICLDFETNDSENQSLVSPWFLKGSRVRILILFHVQTFWKIPWSCLKTRTFLSVTFFKLPFFADSFLRQQIGESRYE